MDFSRPPAYVPPSPSNPFHNIANSQRDAFEPLPTYSRPSIREGHHGRRRPLTSHGSHRSRVACAEHVIPLTVNDPAFAHARSWAHLRIQSSAKSKSHTPSYQPGDEIVGFVELDLLREKSITSMTITLRGYTISSDDFSQKSTFPSPGSLNPAMPNKPIISFLDLKATLWKPSMGDPRSSPPPTAPPCTHRRKKSLATKEFKEKLLGSYSFPFLFTLPHEVDNEPLPPDLLDPYGKMPVQIKYELEVTIQTALFKSDAMILCPLHVVPSIIPPLPSAPRELIYTCRPDMIDTQVMPPGPEQDPEGWSSSKAVRIDKSSCIVSLANPLVYTRGTPIHLHLRFSGGTEIPDPNSLKIALVQTTQVVSGTSRSQRRSASSFGSISRTCIASAVCYRLSQDEGTGIVHGEIKVPKDLTPNFDFKGIHAEYHVLLFPGTTPSGSLAPYGTINDSARVLLSVSVKIATGIPYSPESRIAPLSFLPPHLASFTVNRRASLVPRGVSPGTGSGTPTSRRNSGDGPQEMDMDPFEQLLMMGGQGTQR